MEDSTDYLCLTEVATLLGVTYHTVYRWVVKDKLLSGVQLGRKIWRVPNKELETFIRRRA